MSTSLARIPSLTQKEVEHFYAAGFAGPFAVCSPEEMSPLRSEIESKVLPTPGPWDGKTDLVRHLDSRLVYDLISHPEIVGRLNTLWGPDLMVWRSNFFYKKPGGKAVPWHQDVSYWKLDPPINITMWMALDHVDEENGCVEIIPGSHHKVLKHIESTDDMAFETMADPKEVDDRTAVKMILKPGEFFIFNERVLHYSAPNHSNRMRRCVAARYSLPFVKIPPLWPEHRLIMVSGEDRFGINQFAEPPFAKHP
jgi:hypothetical protein